MKVLITGARGNVGKKLMSYLQSKGYDVYGVGSTAWVTDDYRMVDIMTIYSKRYDYSNVRRGTSCPDVSDSDNLCSGT